METPRIGRQVEKRLYVPIGFSLADARRRDAGARPRVFLFDDLVPADGQDAPVSLEPRVGVVLVGRGPGKGDHHPDKGEFETYQIGAEPGSLVSRDHASILVDPLTHRCSVEDHSLHGTVVVHSDPRLEPVGLSADGVSTEGLHDTDRIYLAASVQDGVVVPLDGGAVMQFTLVMQQEV